jgi:hypothetical protein
MSAPVALVKMAAESCGSTVLNISKCLPLTARQRPVPTFQEIALVGAEDIGQFGPRNIHSWIGTRWRDSKQSRGLTVERTLTLATCR